MSGDFPGWQSELVSLLERAHETARVDPITARSRGYEPTPPQLVTYLVDRVFRFFPKQSLVRVLDPCCGSGGLLAGCVLALGRGRTLHLRGVELDAETATVARQTVRAAAHLAGLACPNPEAIAVGDSLCSPEICGQEGSFDLVIANPPYQSFSGRQRVNVPYAQPERLRHLWPSDGWLTTHGCFLQLAVRMSRRLVAFVLPDQVAHLEGYQAVRDALLAEFGLRELRFWGEGVFPGVVSPILTLIAERGYRGPTAVLGPDGQEERTRVSAGGPWPSLPPSCVRIAESLPIVSLGELVADPGVHTGNCADKLIYPTEEAPANSVPILEGRQIHRYRCDTPTKALRLDYVPRQGEYYTIRDWSKYDSALFLIRQTASRPIVGPREGAVYFRNSLLALYDPASQPESALVGHHILYLVALLNSELMGQIYADRVHEARQRSFPQVKVHSLRKLPIRLLDLGDEDDRALHQEIVALARSLLEAARHQDLATFTDLDARLESLVRQAYGVEPGVPT